MSGDREMMRVSEYKMRGSYDEDGGEVGQVGGGRVNAIREKGV